MANNDINKKIVKLLKKHPEGLAIKQIAKSVGMHRHNVTKYVYKLTGLGVIHQRKIGSVKLCYLKQHLGGIKNE